MSVRDISSKLNDNCRVVSNWMKSNLLKLNAEKTHLLLVGTEERSVTENLDVKIENTNLQEDPRKEETLLGCIMQSNLKWHGHINQLKSRLRIRVAALMKIKWIAPFDVKKQVADSIFTSVLTYCISLFGGMDVGHVKDLQILQNQAAQIVCGAPARTNRMYLFDRVGWFTVRQLVVYHTLTMVFKIRWSKEPEYLSSILSEDTRGQRIRRSNTRLNLAFKSFSFRGPQFWNQLPLSIRTCEKISSFKGLLKKWIQEEIPRFVE